MPYLKDTAFYIQTEENNLTVYGRKGFVGMDKQEKINLWEKMTILFGIGIVLIGGVVAGILVALLTPYGRFNPVTCVVWLVLVLVGVGLIIVGWRLSKKYQFQWWKKIDEW